MTITEALKISDIVRRPGSRLRMGTYPDGWVNIYLLLNEDHCGEALGRRDSRLYLTREDLLADDWEAQEQGVLLTAREITDAIKEASGVYPAWLPSALSRLGL